MNKTNTTSRATIALAMLLTATIGMIPTAAADGEEEPWSPIGYPYCPPVEFADEFPFVWILEDCILPPPIPPGNDPEPDP
jgi:hypothetical protein